MAERIRIGALVDGNAGFPAAAAALAARGGESLQLSFWAHVDSADLPADAARLRVALAGRDCPCLCLGVYGNPLGGDEAAAVSLDGISRLIEAAPEFGATIVSCFAGRVPGRSVEDSLPAFAAAFGPLAESAAKRGISLAFENCRLGDTWKTGKWNIAIGPDAWDLMFAALPGAPLGLEWEPAHQVLALADPIAQLEAWVPRVIHVHAKDARLDREAIALRGVHGKARLGVETLAGRGDSDWAAIFSILSRAGYAGAVDIEIGATPGYQGEREAEGIGLALKSLLEARGTGRLCDRDGPRRVAGWP